MPKPKPISAEDFQSWKDNAITQAFFAHLKVNKTFFQEQWVGMLHADIADPVIMLLERMAFKCKVEHIDDILAIELSDIQEEAENAGSTIERTGKARRQA